MKMTAFLHCLQEAWNAPVASLQGSHNSLFLFRVIVFKLEHLLLLFLGLQGLVLSALVLQLFFVRVTGHVFLVIVTAVGHMALIMRAKITTVNSRSNWAWMRSPCCLLNWITPRLFLLVVLSGVGFLFVCFCDNICISCYRLLWQQHAGSWILLQKLADGVINE